VPDADDQESRAVRDRVDPVRVRVGAHGRSDVPLSRRRSGMGCRHPERVEQAVAVAPAAQASATLS